MASLLDFLVSRATGVLRIRDDALFAVGRNEADQDCTEDRRSAMRWIRGATSVADTFEICQKDAADAFAWSDMTAAESTSFSDSAFRVTDNGDATKQLAFEVSGVTTATTRTLTVPNASGTIALTSNLIGLFIPFIVYDGTTTNIWTNMPAAATELLGVVYYRKVVDLTDCTEFRITADLFVAGVAGSDLHLEYTTDITGATGWTDAGTQATQEIDIGSTGYRTGTWTSLDASARASVLLRFIGTSGNATADPFITNLNAEFR
jgi:hypothetical protein